MGKNITGFMHVAAMGNWKEVIVQQVQTLMRCGLYEKSTHICVTIVGDYESKDLDIFAGSKFILHHGGPLTEYEFPTLVALHKHTKVHDGLVWYIHTKGVGHAKNGKVFAGITDWRKYMEHFILEKHEACIQALITHDCCGVDYKQHPAPHFSGNFFWATCEHIRRLPDIATVRADVHFSNHIQEWNLQERHKAELWLFQYPSTSYKTLFTSNTVFTLERLPRAKYAHTKHEEVVETFFMRIYRKLFIGTVRYLQSEKQAVQAFSIFDWQRYLTFYPDLHTLRTKDQAMRHFLTHGIQERRKFFVQSVLKQCVNALKV